MTESINAIEGSWPTLVSLRIMNNSKHICSGTLLSNSYILIVAHCVQTFSKINPGDLTTVAGITNQSDLTAGHILYIRRIYFYSNYTNRFQNDIAILEVDYPLLIDFIPLLSRTCIPQNHSIHQLMRIGWKTVKNEQYIESELLQQTKVFLIDKHHPNCSNFIYDFDKQFCA
ncbi:hypothetical protein I4U23_027027 [Adineta vaga]|nr:hypothetical protein I4U23_027027 [Adineta vaga]